MSRGPRRDKQDLLGIVAPKPPLASSPSPLVESEDIRFYRADAFDLRHVRLAIRKTRLDFVGVGWAVVHR